MPEKGGRSGSILAAVVVLATLMTGLVLAIVVFGEDLNDSTTPFVVTVLGFLSTTTVSLIALFRIEDTRKDLKNGVIEEPVKRAVESTIEDSDSLDGKIRAALIQVLVDNGVPVDKGSRKEVGKHGR